MPRSVVDDFLDGLRDAATQFATAFVQDRIGGPAPQPQRTRRVNGKPPKAAKVPKQPKARKARREPKGPTLYDDLEVSPHASVETIKAAYLSLSKRYHPDVSKHKNAAERMKQINSAWDILGDEKKRIAYNREIGLRA